MENHQKQLRSLLTLNFQTFDHSRIYAPWSINEIENSFTSILKFITNQLFSWKQTDIFLIIKELGFII
jgi:hypothetical protein